MDKLTSAGLTATYTTTAETAVQLLGAHEFYWWGYGSKLLAKLSDGTSYKFFRIASDFDTVAPTASSSQTDALKIEQEQTNLFHQPYKTIIPPIFVQDVACFFVVDSANVGYLQFYVWNSISNFFELKHTNTIVSSTATDWQTETSLIRTLDGVIFKANNQATIYHIETLTYTYTQTAVTVSWGTFTSYTGTISLSDLFLTQTRDEFLTYSTAETVVPTIAGFMNNDYVFTFTYATFVLTAADAIAMPCNTDQITAGCSSERAFITLKPEHFDLGTNYFAVLSPIDCSAVSTTTTITNASVRYYKLGTVWDIDTNNNGEVDSTEAIVPPAVVASPTAVDWDKGWTCMNVPTTFNWQA